MTAAKCAGWFTGFAPATQTASVLQATAFRGDATRFRLNAMVGPRDGLESAFFAERCGTRVTESGRLITRRSRVQIPPPLCRNSATACEAVAAFLGRTRVPR